jgi:hypothetical protein
LPGLAVGVDDDDLCLPLSGWLGHGRPLTTYTLPPVMGHGVRT